LPCAQVWIRSTAVELENVQPNLADISRPLDIARPPTTALRHLYRDYLKRIIDILATLVTLALLWPLLLAIAVLIRLDSPGPALFIQKRIGKEGRPFQIFKFRTMSHSLDDSAHRKFMQAFVRGDIAKLAQFAHRQRNTFASRSESTGRHTSGTVYKPFSESQVTRIGHILRKTSLDELPQLLNVLKGEMSLIGPRPNVPWEVEAYKTWHRDRLSVLPGITGLAQVSGRSAIDFDTIARYDIEYVRRVSLGLDLRIVIKTVSSVISGNGAH
jgi:lipopolysaccharide/colanic/teichoic acid biosynthesis glycosyltransferase